MGAVDFDALSWEDLMAFEAEQSQPLKLEPEDIQRFHRRTVLYKVDQQGYSLPLVPEDPNAGAGFLTDLLQEMAGEDYLRIGLREYEITRKGRDELEAMAEQYHSLVQHFDIFAHVDLDNSCFLEPGDDPHEQVRIEGELYPRFVDLRVAVMRFKGVSPFDMVFLNLLREGRIGAGDNWEFDLALGQALYSEIEDIVNSAYTLSDLTALGKSNEHGPIPGSDILRDVILAGNQINEERQLAMQAEKRYDDPDTAQIQVEVVEQHDAPLFVDYGYQGRAHYADYRDPFYVEPAWRRHRYRRWF